MSLPKMLADAESVADGFRVTIPESWLQGRTAYGGLTAALCYEAARRQGEALPPLRSALVSFVGPASGDVTVTATLERQGKNAAFVSARLEGEKGVCTTATFVFMRPLESKVDFSGYPMPAVQDPQAGTAAGPGGTSPGFLVNFEGPTFESFEGQGKADMARWLRVKDRNGLDPMTELVLIGDGLPPAAMAQMKDWVPISSLTWMFNVLATPETVDGWWLVRANADHAQEGASSQDMSVWNRDGRLVARGMQSIAIFG